MAIIKKRNEQTETRLLLEGKERVELPPAEVDENCITIQFDSFKPFVPELLELLEDGVMAEPVPVMNDGATYALHGPTRTFWVKLWHAAGSDLAIIERVQVLSCLPSMRGLNIKIGG